MPDRTPTKSNDKVEGSDTPKPKADTIDPWSRAEQVAKIVTLIGIPLVLAVGGWFIQNAVSERSVRKDYVHLATTILTKSDGEIDPQMQKWAIDLLNENSPVKLNATQLNRIKREQELKIITDVLTRSGTERIFILRYLAATLDDPDSRDWAKEEVQRLEALMHEERERQRVETTPHNKATQPTR